MSVAYLPQVGVAAFGERCEITARAIAARRRFFDDIGGAMRIVQIRAREVNLQAFAFQLLACPREIGRIARYDRDFCAFYRKRARTREADALAAARNQDDLAFESEIHRGHPLFLKISDTIADAPAVCLTAGLTSKSGERSR